FTHFSAQAESIAIEDIDKLSFQKKLKYLFGGVATPRPINDQLPKVPYETVYLESDSGNRLEGWLLPIQYAKGTIIILPGYTNVKSHFLDEAYALRKLLPYNILLLDFSAHGGSTGNMTSIGYFEALDIACAYTYAQTLDEDVILYGISMGAVAALRAVSELDIVPKALLLECPYESMLKAVHNRFEMVGIPSFGLAEILVFWGGVQNGYWAFDLESTHYAANINVPTLLMYGALDKRVEREEVDRIYKQLPSPKMFKVFEDVGHSSYYAKHPRIWRSTIKNFLLSILPKVY
ncbi:MAG: alpha/beta hydrolase, partial [Bacteroidota bacterium]